MLGCGSRDKRQTGYLFTFYVNESINMYAIGRLSQNLQASLQIPPVLM